MADIIIRCEKCNTELAAPEELLGQEVRCYGCQTLQVIKAPEPAEPDVPVLQPPTQKQAFEEAPPPVPEPVEAPAFSPMMEISPGPELEMPEPTPREKSTTETASNLNAIPNPLDDLKPISEGSEEEIPTLSLKTQVSQEADPDGIPTLSLKKESKPEQTPVPPAPEPKPEPKPNPEGPTEVTFKCVGCKSILVAPGEHIGYNVRCDNCDTKMPVPETSNATLKDEKTPEPESVPELKIIPLPTPTTPQAPIPEDDDATTNIKIPLPKPTEPAIPKAPIALDDDDDKSIPKLRRPSGPNGPTLPKAPIALDDDDDDKSIIKLRPPTSHR